MKGKPTNKINNFQEANLAEQNEKIKISENSDAVSYAKYRKMIDNIGDVIVIIDSNGLTKYKSPNIEKHFGWKPEEVIGKNALEKVHPEDLEFADEFITTLINDPNVVKTAEIRYQCKDGNYKWIEFTGCNLLHDSDINGLLGNYHDITDRKKVEELLEKRIVALTQPLENDTDIDFEILFNLEDLQKLQDDFSNATGVASIITYPDGTPITKPSNFTVLCNDIIRKTEKGRANCYKSDAIIGSLSCTGPIIQPCLSGGLWDAGSGISVGGKHVANWLIGQVRNETQTEEKMLAYAREIGADEKAFLEAFRKVPAMSKKQFESIAKALHSFSSQISISAYQNVLQARTIAERKIVESKFKLNEKRLDALVQLSQMTNEPLNSIHDFTLQKAIELTKSKIGFLGFVNEKETIVNIYNWSESAMKECAVERMNMEFIVAEAGIWGEVVRTRDVLLLNDYTAPNPLKKGTPSGHVKIKNYLSIPVISNNKVVAMVSVANKEADFNDSDVKQLTLLLYGMWNIVEQRNEQEELKKHRENLEELVKERTIELEEKNKELENFNNLFVGREFRIKELKDKLKKLEKKIGSEN